MLTLETVVVCTVHLLSRENILRTCSYGMTRLLTMYEELQIPPFYENRACPLKYLESCHGGFPSGKVLLL